MKEISLFEVICTDAKGRAFGVTFADADLASDYRAAAIENGWTVDPSPEFCTYGTVGAALADALEVLEKGRVQ